jgi:hypothetical protein
MIIREIPTMIFLSLQVHSVLKRQVVGFSPGPLVSSTNKTDRHDITDILLKMALNTIKQTNLNAIFVFHQLQCRRWFNRIYARHVHPCDLRWERVMASTSQIEKFVQSRHNLLPFRRPGMYNAFWIMDIQW